MLRILIFFFLIFVQVCPASADEVAPQISPHASEDKLDQLFATLQKKDVGALAMKTEAEIWDLWMKGGNDQENEKLYAATKMMNAGSFDLAEELLNELIAKNQKFAEAYNKRATLYFLMGKLDESLNDIVKTLELEPRHFGALSGRGMIYVNQKKYPEAIKAYREALTMNPNMFGVIATMKQLEKLQPDL